MAKVDQVLLLPIPEANTRLAALRSGRVDWIEVPPPDGIPSLKQAGFVLSTGSYPHVWPWLFNMAAKDSPLKDVRVRQALNYCIDRDGLVTLLNGTAEPSVGWLKPANPGFGNPANRYGFDPAKGKALLAKAGYTAAKPLSFKVMISTSGSGQMLPRPMNDYLRENLAQACGVRVEFHVVDWAFLWAAPDSSVTPRATTGTSAEDRGLTRSTCRPTWALSWSGVPTATTRPRSITTTSSASRSASSMYWVVSRTVTPSPVRSRMTSHRSLRARGSRPVVGSSRYSTRGRPTRLAARSRRRRMPPE